MIMVHGVKSRIMERCGTRSRWTQAGLLTAMGIGTGLARGAGPGLITRPGASRPIITDAGRLWEARGAGAQDRSMRVRFMDRHSLVSSAGDLESDSDSAAESAGSRSDSANRIIRGITPAEITSAT